MLRRYLSSLKSTYYFMISFGLLMGVVFPFYSSLFFGAKAFSPLYVAGCLTAGFLVGTFCYQIIKQVLRLYLEPQWQTLTRIVGPGQGQRPQQEGDELQMLMVGFDTLMGSVLAMVEQVSALIGEIVPLYQELTLSSRDLERGNEKQVKEVRRTREAAAGMQLSFHKVLQETEELTTRTQTRARLAAELSDTTEAIAGSIKEYSGAVGDISASIAQMASSLRQTNGHIAGLTESTEKTSSSIVEISAAVDNVRDNAQRSSSCSENVRLQAQEGMRSMEATRHAMTQIERANQESSQCINRLVLKITRVSEMLAVIQEVVQQTNLLSLNAFIIAAQAGEHGKAFSVVAQEVKSLALRTADSAAGIERLVGDLLHETEAVRLSVGQGTARVQEGVEISRATAEALVRIEESAAEASEMVKKIALATEEQAAGTRLISNEVENNLNRGRQITAAAQEQERGAALIVRSLEQMKELAARLTSSSQEQARGNKLYLNSVIEDSDKARQLAAESEQQLQAAREVEGFIRETGLVIEANADEAKRIAARIEAISQLTERLKAELAPFKGSPHPAASP